MLGRILEKLARVAAGQSASFTGMTNDILKRAEGAFVGATNIAMPSLKRVKGVPIPWPNGAKSSGEAMNRLFPFWNQTAPKHLDTKELGKIFSDDFLHTHDFKNWGHGHKIGFSQTPSFSQAEMMAGARDSEAAERISKLKVSTVRGKGTVISETMADNRKFAMNPAIIRNVALGVGAVSAVGGYIRGLPYKPPDPTVYYDGQNMRSINDMGANADYGRAIMGRNSRL